ncbi:Tylosin resistance ATP-binding protein TlrC [Seminavis robusta]|uniref:Tylosin resistance ATP-binding protein TlrC n=1 Tax=Seminavis robusta TaxID=568900 RepID=A0A9N8E065_9STRA|nr:Tylosin resistance ATP-binding protein TlrC [Seminavis robusta]|eukprot:Sro419_g139050.1 Tylosin resistance ATP-binding protein TlrC (785) ;mRNA; f:25134-28112
MSSKWHEKKNRLAAAKFERDLQNAPEASEMLKNQTSEVAMGGGEEELFEKKMTKEEKKAAKKAAREAKRKSKKSDDDDTATKSKSVSEVMAETKDAVQEDKAVDDDGLDHETADALASAGTICTFSASKKGVDARSRDINVQNFTLQHMGAVMLDETEIVLNHGNRYGLIGRNGCGKSTLLKALGARAVPIPRGIDLFFLDEEVEPSDTVSALDAVMAVDEQRLRLEKQAEELNQLLSTLAEGGGDDADGEEDKTPEEQQEEVMDALNSVYERLDALDASTAEVRARTILKGLGFTHEMQGKKTKDFSGGWRMRVSLARALFIQPVCLLLDEPTNHLDMEAVIWLEDYLSRWNRILLLVSHSQDFLNNVCTHMIHFTHRKKLHYYDGNYDQFIKTKSEKEENQMKQYKWEQEQIKSMKEYIARFGHGTAKNAKQAQSKEKVLAKMIRAGLTEKPDEEKPLNFKFQDPGHLPPPVLAFHDVKFGYPNCELLYSNVNFGVDLDSRVALVGPNGAGKTTLVKLMAGELQPTLGDIRPHGHLKLGRFTQHFIDVLDLEMTPLEFFEQQYPNDPREEQRKYLGRFGVSGRMQVQKMAELSDGQKSRVVFAKLGRDVPHILLLDEPTNHLDMESIDALAKAVNEFEGGLILVSHDMRLISQVAQEIWICDNKTITKYKGDILNFKMDMRAQMGIEGDQVGKLRGDASVKKKEGSEPPKPPPPKKEPKLEVVPPKPKKPAELPKASPPPPKKEEPPKEAPAPAPPADDGRTRYIPPHVRRKMQQEQQQQSS